jgi:hypothetical protein
MLFLSLFSLLDIRKNPSDKGVKLLSNHLSRSANNTFILKPRTSNGVACPAVLPDTDTCSSTRENLATAIGDAVDADGIEAAINSYLTACPASQCQSSCVNFITETGKTVVFADKNDLLTDLSTVCTSPTPVNSLPVTCTGAKTDAASCTLLFNGVLTEVERNPWNGANIAEKVNLFTASCLATICDNACEQVVSGVNLVSHYESFKTSFLASCTPITPVEESSDSIKSEGNQSENQQSEGQQSDGEESNDSKSNEGKGNDDKGGDWGLMSMKPSFTLLSILFGTYLLQSLLD